MSEESTADPLEQVTTWDTDGNPYWNGVARSANKPPGTGLLHKARIESGRVVEVECHARVDAWVAYTARSAPQEDRRTCSNCGRLTEVPGVVKDRIFSVNLTDEYDPAKYGGAAE